MSKALNQDNSFKATVQTSAQRGMTNQEAIQYLVTGEYPNLTLPSDVEDVLDPTSDEEDYITPIDALLLLDGVPLTTDSGQMDDQSPDN